jgi:hypothetical protein
MGNANIGLDNKNIQYIMNELQIQVCHSQTSGQQEHTSFHDDIMWRHPKYMMEHRTLGTRRQRWPAEKTVG